MSAKKLVSSIAASKTPPLAKFITALGIRHVGAQTASTLAQAFGSIEKLQIATEEELQKLPDVGQIVTESILAWFADEDNLKLLDELKTLGVQPVYKDLSNLPLVGKSYIISGTLEGMGREAAEDKLRALGATVTSGVTKNTTALIVGKKPGKSKTEKAAALGIPIIGETEFQALIAT